MTKPRVYLAGKLSSAETFRNLVLDHPEIQFTSGWMYLCAFVSDDNKDLAENFWAENLKDIESSDYVLVVPTPGKTLRGALIEAGYGYALGKTIMLIGDSDDYGTWRHMEGVMNFTDPDGLHKAVLWLGTGRDEYVS